MKTFTQTSILLLAFTIGFTACKNDKCGDEPDKISVAVKNLDGSAAQLDKVYWIDLSTKDTTRLATNTSGIYILADDNSDISGSATFRFDAYQGTFLVASEDYILKKGECHIEKNSGKSTITLD